MELPPFHFTGRWGGKQWPERATAGLKRGGSKRSGQNGRVKMASQNGRVLTGLSRSDILTEEPSSGCRCGGSVGVDRRQRAGPTGWEARSPRGRANPPPRRRRGAFRPVRAVIAGEKRARSPSGGGSGQCGWYRGRRPFRPVTGGRFFFAA